LGAEEVANKLASTIPLSRRSGLGKFKKVSYYLSNRNSLGADAALFQEDRIEKKPEALQRASGMKLRNALVCRFVNQGNGR